MSFFMSSGKVLLHLWSGLLTMMWAADLNDAEMIFFNSVFQMRLEYYLFGDNVQT